MKTLADIIERNDRFYPDVVAFAYENLRENKRVTYRELAARSRRLSAAIYSAGLRRQDRVGILAMNCPEYFEVYAACHLAGFITSTVNFRLAGPEIAWIVNDAQPSVFIFEDQYTDLVASLRDQLTSVRRFVCIGNAPDWAIQYETFLQSGSSAGAPIQPTPADVANLIYTSGTTGRPKGVKRTHAAELAVARGQAMMLEMRVNGSILVVMPMFHVGAMSMILPMQYQSGTTILHRKFDPVDVLKTIQSERAEATHMAPIMVQAVLDVPEVRQYDVSSLKMLCYAAAPMPVAVLKRGLEIFGQVFLNSWGQTEGGTTAFARHLHRIDGTAEDIARLASIGQPCAPCRIRIVDDAGQDCPSRVAGEIWVDSPTNMVGYWNNDVATIETLRDGWLRTGDMGYMDEQGFIYLVDRKKDMIISGGENIYSQEVEQALAYHPAVGDVAVIGIPDEKWGESALAIVVRKNGQAATESELVEFCTTRIARYKRPKHIVFLEEMPRLPSGKINKVVLRTRYRNRSAR